MSEERTQPATPRRRKKAREEGQVARSVELTGSAALLGLLAALPSMMPAMAERISTHFVHNLDALRMASDLGPASLRQMAGDSMNQAFLMALPAMTLAVGLGVGANLLQIGFVVTPQLLQPRLHRLDPLQGLRRVFAARAGMEIVKGLLKVACVGGAGWHYLVGHQEELFRLAQDNPREIGSRVGAMTYDLALQMAGTMAVLAALDYAYQRYQFERGLRMTRQEVRDEMRESEGSPEIRQRIRQRQREFARRRMMAAVPTATVVLANPTHYAVALRYDRGQRGAPRVVAKGQDLVALKIREIAQSRGVPVVENPPLARALYVQSDLGREIPADLYRAVAEVLAMIWRLDLLRGASGAA